VGATRLPLQTRISEAIADFYDGALHEVNFRTQPDEAVKTIKPLGKRQARSRIKDLIHRSLLDADTRLILTNAIYFKGQWRRNSKGCH